MNIKNIFKLGRQYFLLPFAFLNTGNMHVEESAWIRFLAFLGMTMKSLDVIPSEARDLLRKEAICILPVINFMGGKEDG